MSLDRTLAHAILLTSAILFTACTGKSSSAPEQPELNEHTQGEEADADIPGAPKAERVHGGTRHFVVALDAGHSKVNGGARSAHGKFEYEFNRQLVSELAPELRASRLFEPLLINPKGADVRLTSRSLAANQAGADLFLSIHHDSVKDRFLKDWNVDGSLEKYTNEFHGYSVFFSRKNPDAAQSLAFAKLLGATLREAAFTPTLHHAQQENRPIIDKLNGVYAFDDLIVLKTANMPAVLLECGVILNPKEEEELQTSGYRKRLVGAIASAIEQFSTAEAAESPSN
jgi:N-acetylmuramoyl-L-alanine amidase